MLCATFAKSIFVALSMIAARDEVEAWHILFYVSLSATLKGSGFDILVYTLYTGSARSGSFIYKLGDVYLLRISSMKSSCAVVFLVYNNA